MTSHNQQHPFRSREMLNRYTKKAKLIRQNIRLRNTKCIQSDRSILGLSVQILVSHITNHNISHIAALHFWHNNRYGNTRAASLAGLMTGYNLKFEKRFKCLPLESREVLAVNLPFLHALHFRMQLGSCMSPHFLKFGYHKCASSMQGYYICCEPIVILTGL